MSLSASEKPLAVLTHWVHDEVLEFLEPHCRVLANPERTTLPAEEVLRRASEAHGIMVFMPDSVDGAFLDACPRLRMVAAALKGADNFDISACASRGVWFSLVPDLLTIPTAELAVGLMIGLGRHILAGDAHLRSGDFAGWRPLLYGTGLAGTTVGLIGLGAVGRAVARRLVGWDCRLLACDPHADASTYQEVGAEQVSLHELLAASDYVLPLTPLTPETLHLIDAAALAAMRPGALLVNVCRGSVVNEAAVACALQSGHLGGYGADVFELEDWARAERPRAVPASLLTHPRTLFTPHVGSAVESVRREIAMSAARNLVEGLAGRRPPQAVNTPDPNRLARRMSVHA